jgi:hypothetical protein
MVESGKTNCDLTENSTAVVAGLKASRAKKLWLGALVAVWLIILLFGHKLMNDYESEPGTIHSITKSWPAACQLNHNGWTIVLAAHPFCPCTRATLNELNRLLSRCHSTPKIYALFYRPKKFEPNWNKTDLWREVSTFPGAIAIDDVDGLQSALFGADTSGETFLFSPEGKLLYHGGITAARGHEGDNAGEDSIISGINTGKVSVTDTPAFGCAIR